MLTTMWSNPAASACALWGAICMVGWPLCRTRHGMLLVQIGNGFGVHYALSGCTTAAIVNGLGAGQIAASLLLGTSPWLRWLGLASMPVTLSVCALTWSGVPSVLAGVGQTLMMLGRVQISPSAIRFLVLSGTLFWAAHDRMIGSPLLIVDLLSLAIGSVTLLRQAGSRLRRAQET